jgi:LmbE family N-acetylglucosaminyl deacetylase
MSNVSRRRFVSGSIVTAAALPLTGTTAEAAGATTPALKVLVIGAHPGDLEAGCGGTIARYADAGHDVVALYLTRGEAGVSGKTHEQAAAVRTTEAEAACRILKARPAFAGQLDGATEVTAARYAEFAKLVVAEKPDVVLTQWPLDTHADHRACAALTYDAWLRSGRSFALYFYEVDLGSDTQCFRPTHYVDVTETEPRKRAACMAHASQNPAGPTGFYVKDHEPMLRFRGMECGRKSAEAFIHHDQSPPGRLPES